MFERSFGLSPIFGLRREIDRLFDDTFVGRGGTSWNPAVDIHETSNELRLDVELPGIREEDIQIEVENGMLSIRGEKSAERKEGEEGRYHLVERSYGSFFRSFQLPQGVDEKQIRANFNNGVLEVSIPKAALPQPRRIQIAGTGGESPRSGETGTPRRDDRARRGGASGKEETDRARMVAKPSGGENAGR
jgi:HSP20 family protein